MLAGSPPRVWGMPSRGRISRMIRRFTPTCVGNAQYRRAPPQSQPVHPHVCGECPVRLGHYSPLTRFTPTCVGNASRATCASASAPGSPPRVWGMLLQVGFQLAFKRFTPTCVGNAAPAASLEPPAPVHPHVCGECCLRIPVLADSHGSPPRVWGMRTHATDSSHPKPVHPHVCGECVSVPASAYNTTGSPPRVWGMHFVAEVQPHIVRFTPTCVGNARPLQWSNYAHAVHPHVCGECTLRKWGSGYCAGSPPRVWGMRVGWRPSHQGWRFTPTCVGNAPHQSGTKHLSSVHPHVCGECADCPLLPGQLLGSPPRVWGMLLAKTAVAIRCRFTPTCVGNAQSSSPYSTPLPVHPHVCGECPIVSAGKALWDGSPPRVWGMPILTYRRRCAMRFTPTCVGNA